jgi:hypothetical protein
MDKIIFKFNFFFHIHHDTHPLDVNLNLILMCNHICLKGVGSKYIFNDWGFQKSKYAYPLRFRKKLELDVTFSIFVSCNGH